MSCVTSYSFSLVYAGNGPFRLADKVCSPVKDDVGTIVQFSGDAVIKSITRENLSEPMYIKPAIPYHTIVEGSVLVTLDEYTAFARERYAKKEG